MIAQVYVPEMAILLECENLDAADELTRDLLADLDHPSMLAEVEHGDLIVERVG